MATGFNKSQFEAAIRGAARKQQAEIDRVNRENKRRLEAYNRQVDQVNACNWQAAQRQLDAHNRQVDRVNTHNRQVNQRNQRADEENRTAVANLNRQLRSIPPLGPAIPRRSRRWPIASRHR